MLWLATAMRVSPPESTFRKVADQVSAARRRRWLPVQMAAAALGLLLFWHGLSNVFMGEWLASQLGEPYNPHVVFEGGIAFVAAGLAVLAGAYRARWLPVAVAIGAPFGILLAANGAHEVTEFALGAVLHLAEGAFAIALLVTWWLAWRYGRRDRREE